MQEGTLDALIVQSKNGIMRAVDAYFLDAIQASTIGAGTLACPTAMKATVLASMWGSIMAGSYKPSCCVMHPVQYASLLQDQQFTNAMWRGKSSIIDTGEIGIYIAMDIVPLIQGTLANGTFSPGTYKAIMMSKGACVGAIKRELEIEKEYYVKNQTNYVVASIRFGGTVVHTNGVGLITTVGG